MKDKRNIIGIILAVVITIPFLINVFGWSLYCYKQCDGYGLVVGSVSGLIRVAKCTPIKNEGPQQKSLDHRPSFIPTEPVYISELINFTFYVEPRFNPVMPFYATTFIRRDHSFIFRGFEIPQLIFLLAPILIVYFRKRQPQNP